MINWNDVSLNDVICYYAFVFDLDISLVLEFAVHDLDEIALCKLAIENWKKSE
ncbi:TPA: hypothetical protein TVW26_001596 [Streptococcus equi subsp. equi]|uniref:hypothetical protein n=1 Tax=Streptococcus equi TaxID=1336 RepID=UPI000659EAD1|nr:hypothetical protein [Streptococcus equi]QBX15441.1 hypothetical protein Javan187_0005 [Streptococcus phage Javan187]MBT1199217.1 hypothetical protein [Streptococcus equi subsp. equi]MBT1201054.1 hypothetical protein [Streptococcus equi subsp. equi]MBT1211462.1 hypothetical protein [Streptococcus equi subsp. equi]MCD3433654.1 hypothetical protein [Streptococcus equi subsp. zooepidemicus]